MGYRPYIYTIANYPELLNDREPSWKGAHYVDFTQIARPWLC
jgi:hypothetical protein